jgi:hypothetical protein
MGTRFGLPLAASLGDALRSVVLGKFGLLQAPGLPAGLDAPDRVLADARRITAPPCSTSSGMTSSSPERAS